ncbi:MAG TPA: hypothetical protein DCY20_07965 [Firmicutes bacterium]|nr:hypothetical protein [Bacillota bacterium]
MKDCLKRIWDSGSQMSMSFRRNFGANFTKVVEQIVLQIGWNRGNNSRPYALSIGMRVFLCLLPML